MVPTAKSIGAGPAAFARPEFRKVNYENFKLVLVRPYAAELSIQDLKDIRKFRWDLEGDSDNPTILGSGREGIVYAISDGLAAKRIFSLADVFEALKRMVYLHEFVKANAPEFIRVPVHYGAFRSRVRLQQFLLMQRVSRLSVEELREDAVDGEESPLLSQVTRAVDILYDWFRERVSLGELSRELLPDLAYCNILVDTARPTHLFPFTLWVVDQ